MQCFSELAEPHSPAMQAEDLTIIVGFPCNHCGRVLKNVGVGKFG